MTPWVQNKSCYQNKICKIVPLLNFTPHKYFVKIVVQREDEVVKLVKQSNRTPTNYVIGQKQDMVSKKYFPKVSSGHVEQLYLL